MNNALTGLRQMDIQMSFSDGLGNSRRGAMSCVDRIGRLSTDLTEALGPDRCR